MTDQRGPAERSGADALDRLGRKHVELGRRWSGVLKVLRARNTARAIRRSMTRLAALGWHRPCDRHSGMRSSGVPTAKLSVLHLLAPARVGGLEAVVQALTLGARGSSVEARIAAVVLPGEPDHPFFTPFRGTDVEVFAIEAPRRGYLHERASVARLCRRLEPDVVHTHGYRADVIDAPVARRLGLPVVSTVHGFTSGDWRNRFYEWLGRRALRRFDAVVAVSRPLAAELERSGLPRGLVHYVQNAWHSHAGPPLDRAAACRTLGVEPDTFRVGWVGRLTEEKGPGMLVEALGHLRDLPVTVSFLGDGPLRQALEARSRALGVAERIRWHGVVAGAARLLRAFGAFALSSRTEGTPVVLFEAMAAGVPIVASAVGGVPDVVSTAEAWLVPAGDSGALAEAIRGVAANPSAALKRAGAARERLEREFGLAACLERYEAVYRAVRRTADTRRFSSDAVGAR